MKTLDEVIKTIDYCMFTSDCNPCSYKEVKDCTREKMKDALHYLKEYSSKQDTIAEQLAELEQKNDHVCEMAKTVYEEYDRLCNRLAEEYRNDPLTWEELKQMIDSIVWLEWSSDGNWAEIIHATGDRIEYYRFGTDEIFYFTKEEYVPDKWQAYRKERE